MNSIYSDYYLLLSDAFNYPATLSVLIQNQINSIDKKIREDDRENVLNLFNGLLEELNSFIKTEGEQYFFNKSAIAQSLAKAEHYAESFEEIAIESQTEERFYAQMGDSFFVRLKKAPKRWLQNIFWLIPKTKNLYYKIRKKEVKPLNYKKHRVKKRQLALLVFINYFLRKSDDLYDDTLEKRQNILLQLTKIIKELCENLLLNNEVVTEKHFATLRNISPQIDHYKSELKIKIGKIEKDLTKEFVELQLKFGTFEFPARKTRTSRLLKQRQKANKKHAKILDSHQLICYALSNYTEYYKNIQQIFVNTSNAFGRNRNIIVKRLEDNIETSFVPFYKELKSWIDEHNGKNVFNTQALTQKILGVHIPDFTNAVLQIDLNTPIENLNVHVNNQLSEINTCLTIPSGADYDEPINKKSLRHVDTKLILQGEYKVNIEAKLAKKQLELTQTLQKFLRKTNEITQIIEFSLEYMETTQAEQKDEIALEFYNGIKRALTKSGEVLKLIEDTKENIKAELQSIDRDFISSLNRAIEPVIILRTIKKEKIKHQVTLIKKSLYNYFHTNIPLAQKAWHEGKKAFHFIRINYLNLRVLFGISEAAKSISNELSHYLSETEATINSLPLMYQKLFKPEALTKERLYIARQAIDEELETALNVWLLHKFAPTCLVGEAGMGVTTTLNFFEKKIKEQHTVYRFKLDKQITDKADFFEFIKLVFNDLTFESFDDLREKLMTQGIKRVIILQNIHYLYGRYNDGFLNVNSFLNLISITNPNVFWVCSAKQYPWDYLNYAINISDYFGYIVQMKSLDKEQVIKTIDDRHLPSGYAIKFIARESFKATRKFKNSNEEHKQNILRNDFFNVLYKNTQGNIKLALLFWKMAVVGMENDQFSFQLKEIDHSFLESLGTQKMATLHNILIHDGLSIEEHSKVFGIPFNQSASHLLLMENDAVIVLQNGQYQINPLLYKHVVDHLKAINFVY